jgi:eukaryotic-like serine/threonine-protein kinase
MSDVRRSDAPNGTDAETRLDGGVDIGPYHLISIIGAGGMGRVFRARDSKLNRDVALKLLPEELAHDLDRMARFTREAQAPAALNHPNIAAIYGLEESGGRQALVLELVEGTTLADRIANGPLPLRDALTLALQIAHALRAAHDKGIVHRDLKPANIKVTPAGVVKVLDFGLAKTAAPDPSASDFSQSPTLLRQGYGEAGASPAMTRAGVILGTAAYMSPEQARGQQVDQRTDIWAFGCVLFEMLTGRKAFAADANSDSIAKILDGEPDWPAVPKSTPVAVQRLLRRCLEKDVNRRLSTVTEADRVIERLLAPRVLTRRTGIAIGAAALLAVAGSIYIWSQADRRPIANRSDWVQLTKLDAATQPALSPDGRMLAFIRGSNTLVSPGQVYVKLLPAGDAVALTHDNLPKMGPMFSPDGSRIAYTVNEGDSWDTWEVPALRGEPRPWLHNASGLTWISADDLLFSEIKTGQHMAIVRASQSRENARDVYVPPHESGMAHRSYSSPDGKWVLVVEMNERGVWTPCRLLGFAGNTSTPVGPSPGRCTGAAWSPDGRWMYFSTNAGDGFHLWRQQFPNGKPEQLTSGPTEEEGVTIAADGKSLVTSVGFAQQRSVWFHDASGDRQISLEGYAYWPLLSADGRKVCFRVTQTSGTGQTPSELWLADVDSGQTRRLFPGQLVTSYDLSPDDRVVAAVMEADGQTHVWLSRLDGREKPRPIPQAVGDNPRFGRDDEIVFRVIERNSALMYRIRANGDGREKLTEARGTAWGTVSPDGAWVSCAGCDAGKNSMYSTTSGRAPLPILPSAETARLRWSADGQDVFVSIQYGQASAFGTGRTYVLPLAAGSVLPRMPSGGFGAESEIAAEPGVEAIPYGDVAPGPTASVYAYSRETTTRNLYRIPLH